MNTYLLEIGVEELPAKQMTRVMAGFKSQLIAELEKENLVYGDLHLWSTPRRIAVFIEGIADKIADEHAVVYGPRVAAAYKDGEPTPALLGFLKKNAATAEDVTVAVKGGNEVVSLNTVIAGVDSKAVISKLASAWVTAAAFDKSMRWRDYNVQFSRPIRWIASLYNSEHLPVAIEGLTSDIFTYGHRTLANRRFDIPKAQSYLEIMAEACVVVDPLKRRESILEQIAKLEKTHAVKAEKDEALLDEIVNIVEYPTVFAAHFDREFLSLPVPVITTPMKDHQRYFPTFARSGELSDVFFGVRNGGDYCLDVVARGNEKVLRARLKDAQFFFAEDGKKRLEDFVENLKTVVYQARLGTVFEKVERIDALSEHIAGLTGLDGELRPLLHRTVMLCKADLNTAMVNEFDELQGVVGKIYAGRDGEDARICTAVESHYLPRFSGDDTPKDPLGRIIGIADKTDSLVGSYGIGVTPKGNKDPFGLRRMMIGILVTLLSDTQSFNPDLESAIAKSVEILSEKLTQPKELVVEQVRDALLQRLRGIMDEKGYRFDVIEAGLPCALRDVASFVARSDALAGYDRKKLEAVTTNQLRAVKLSAAAKDGLAVDVKLFDCPAEKTLYEAITASGAKVETLVAAKDFAAAIDELESLGNAIAIFLEDVIVMHENENIRENRMQLMRMCANIASQVADFTALQFSYDVDNAN